MLNETFILQLILFVTLGLYTKLLNILALWYAAGLYLIFLGLLLLIDDGDVFVGFLWVVDLGVGLIFFIFILHFSNFLYQKTYFNVFTRAALYYCNFVITVSILLYFLIQTPTSFNTTTRNNWFYSVSWYNFYLSFSAFTVSTLQLLRELYFFNNSFEFVMANFMLLYGIFLAVILCFLLKKVFTAATLHQFQYLSLTHTSSSSYFIRQQNFLRQQNTSTGTRVWKKYKPKNDI